MPKPTKPGGFILQMLGHHVISGGHGVGLLVVHLLLGLP